MLDFPASQITITDEAYVLSSETPLLTLSSAVVGGGFQHSRAILNLHVPLDYNCADPASDLLHFAGSRGLSELFVGMMTGVPMHGTRIVNVRSGNLIVSTIITAGISNAVTTGVSKPVPFKPGTINVAILVDANLAPSAMVNAVITATEAKSSLLAACGITAGEGYAATGTSTDAIVIACSGRDEILPYAGPGTDVGYLIGRSVRECLIKALEPCGVVYRERGQCEL